MQVIETALPGVLILEPRVFRDARGFFMESWNERVFQEATGGSDRFVQDNHSRSSQRVLRGIHYQLTRPQGKLVRAVVGEILDVAVDLRRPSPFFGKWIGVRLSAENFRQLWIPPGFGHGFAVMSQSADVLYKTTDYWLPEHERCIVWNDRDLSIDWELDADPLLAPKDAAGLPLTQAEIYD